MKISVEHTKNDHSIIEFTIEVEEDDKIIPSEKYSLSNRSFSFIISDDIIFEDIHPDHLALVSILACHPFIGKRIVFPKPISKQFFDAGNIIRRYNFENVDESLEPWEASTDSRPALAFSGGADSTAALALLPANTVSVFLDRPLKKVEITRKNLWPFTSFLKKIKSRTLYDKDAVNVACDNLKDIGYEVKKIESDIEYVRSPIGFPVDVANAAPAILLANHLEFDSIAFGTIMESAFGVGHKEYRNYPLGNHYTSLGTLFEAAGLPFLQVVSGVSEVGTAIINKNSLFGDVAQSCMRGKWLEPCRNCWKCFRKLLLDSVINNKKLNEEEFTELFKIREAKHYLSQFPIKHENVLTYSMSKYDEHINNSENNIITLFQKRVRGDVLNMDWLERYYPKMFEVIPAKYKNSVKEKLENYLKPMSTEEENKVENWDMKPMLENEEYQKLHENFCNRIS